MSAIGNVIAFHSNLPLGAVVGAFNDRARDVWAWAFAEVPESFHPRHAKERWYRYHIFEDVSIPALRGAGALFVGEHDFGSFTSDPPAGPFAIRRVDVSTIHYELRMRVALKIAYDGRDFHGHQRQPVDRTVEGECLLALRSARIISDPQSAFFRSASRTDRGVSAIGNVIAFHSNLPLGAVVGAFNDRARDVWAWAFAEVPESFHPRHAKERWYRYHIFEDVSIPALRGAGALFVGEHDFGSFTSDPPAGPFAIRCVDVSRRRGVTLVDVRARSFRRGMVRRIVAAMIACARGDILPAEIRAALEGTHRDFGSVPPEPLFLMDVDFGFPFTPSVKPKVAGEWFDRFADVQLRERWLLGVADASGLRETQRR